MRPKTIVVSNFKGGFDRLDAVAPSDVAIFPRAEHGIFEYETAADGTRLSTRNSEGYFATMRDYILEGRLWRSYGTSILHVSSRELAQVP